MDPSATDRVDSSQGKNPVASFLLWLFLLLTGCCRSRALEKNKAQEDNHQSAIRTERKERTNASESDSTNENNTPFDKGKEDSVVETEDETSSPGPSIPAPKTLQSPEPAYSPNQHCVGTQTPASFYPLPEEKKESSPVITKEIKGPSTPTEAPGQKKKAKRCDTDVVLTLPTTAPSTSQEVNSSGGSILPNTSSREKEAEQAQGTVVIQIENPEPEERRQIPRIPWRCQLVPDSVRLYKGIFCIVFVGIIIAAFLYNYVHLKNLDS